MLSEGTTSCTLVDPDFFFNETLLQGGFVCIPPNAFLAALEEEFLVQISTFDGFASLDLDLLVFVEVICCCCFSFSLFECSNEGRSACISRERIVCSSEHASDDD